MFVTTAINVNYLFLLEFSYLGISLLPLLIDMWLAPGSPSSLVKTCHPEAPELDLDEILKNERNRNRINDIIIIFLFFFSRNLNTFRDGIVIILTERTQKKEIIIIVIINNLEVLKSF